MPDLARRVPRAHRSGIAPLIGLRIRAAAAELGFGPVEVSLVGATNQRMRRVVEAFGCEHVKTFRLYVKEVEAGAEVNHQDER